MARYSARLARRQLQSLGDPRTIVSVAETLAPMPGCRDRAPYRRPGEISGGTHGPCQTIPFPTRPCSKDRSVHPHTTARPPSPVRTRFPPSSHHEPLHPVAMDCPPTADDAFGPAVHSCRGSDFDFTLTFEQSLFQIAPSALLLLLAPLRAKQLIRQNVKTVPSFFSTAKQVAIAILAATQLALLVVWATTPAYRTAASIPAATVSFLASLMLLVLSTMEHSRSVRPSSLINSWILFSLLLDLPQARTLWLRSGPRSLAAVFTTGLVAKAVVLCLEARSKRRSLFPAYRRYAPESVVGLYDRTLLWWLNGLFWKGYRSLIGLDSLYTISESLSSETVEAGFQRKWAKWRLTRGKRPLFWALTESFKRSILGIAIPRLSLSAFKLAQPLLINRITLLLSRPATERSENIGRTLVGAATLIYLGLAICNALYKRQLHRLLAQVRGATVTAVHSHALRLSSDKLHDAAALTLITADVQRLNSSLQQVDGIFAAPFEVAIAVFLLEQQIGLSCIAPIAVAVLISAISFANSNTAISTQKAWLSAVSERVAYTASVLAAPKGFKMLGLTDYLTERIQSLRVAELAKYAHYRKYVTWRNVFSFVPESLAPPVTLMMFTLINGGAALTPAVAFTTLSLVVLLSGPTHDLIHAIPMLQTALASLDRIQEFLLLEPAEAGVTSQQQPAVSSEPRTGVELASLSKSNQRLKSSIRFERGAIRLGKDDHLILQDLDVAFQSNTINLVVGPVGCGKSTLLRAIAGDVCLALGVLQTPDKIRYAYCAQDPWLPNDTVRNLIVSESDLDQQWYCTVKTACALDNDIASLPQSDDTVVGNGGVSLSGGQRQRLALARALYARHEVLVIDDVLSGLDANTAQSVFDRVLGPTGLCKTRGMTAIVATHAVKHLRDADNIVALGMDGRVQEQGAFRELESKKGYIHELSVKGTQGTPIAQEETIEPVPPARPADKLAEAEQDLARQTGDVKVYGHYARSLGWTLGSIVVGTAVAAGFLMTFPTVWVRWWAEAAEKGYPQRPLGLW